MTAPERKARRLLPVFQMLTNVGSIIHLVHKYNIGHKTKEQVLNKNSSKYINEQGNIGVLIFSTPDRVPAS